MKTAKELFTPGAYRLRVRRTRTGRGLITEEAILKNACIIEYKGRPVSEAEQKADKGKYLFWNTDTTMINGNVPGNIAKYINHACKPNCEVDLYKKRIYIFAKRNIKAGEELTYDYGPEYFDKHIGARGCLCATCAQDRKNSRAATEGAPEANP